MWLGDITYGDTTQADPATTFTTTPAPDPSTTPGSTTNSLINLAAGLVDAIHPYKQGVPVNVGITPQTQSFLMMGGILVGGLVILSLMRKR